jgi:outer membrane immunogenic protein
VKPTNNLLIFGKAGWARQNVRTRLKQDGAPTISSRGTEHGFLWGGGAAYALSKNVSLRADFDHM